MQIANRTTNVPITPTTESSPASSMSPALKAMLQRVASSTRLNFAQKHSFAEAIKNAFETGNGKLMVKIMMMVAQAEAQAVQGKYRAHSVNEILSTGQPGSGAETLDTTQQLSGQDRIRQLLFS